MSFSIITTVLNGEKFIEHCINSVEKQNYAKNIEHIIVDGGSSDQTLKILKRLSITNKKLKIIEKKNINIYQGINIGIHQSKNEIIGILNSDDFYANEKVLYNVDSEFQNNKEVYAIHSNVIIFRRNNLNKIFRLYKSKNYLPDDYMKCKHPPHTSIFVKKEIYEKFGNFNEELKIASDFEFMLRVFGKNSIKTKFVDKTFVHMRSHGSSSRNLNNIILSNYEVIQSFKINNIKISYFQLMLKILSKIKQIKLI